jgi:Cna protein B-type domain.
MIKIFSVFALITIFSISVFAQALGSAGTVSGTVVDPNGALVAGATVTLSNSVTGYNKTVTTDSEGSYVFNNVPPNTYTLHIAASGFGPDAQSVIVRSSVPMQIPAVSLALGGSTATVDIAAAAIEIENIPSTHTDVDQSLISRLPLTSPGNGLSDAVTLTSPGVVADSNGFFHPLGDHAQSQISVDNQPITDQQSKAFSTQLPVNAIQSMEVITGAVPCGVR